MPTQTNSKVCVLVCVCKVRGRVPRNILSSKGLPVIPSACPSEPGMQVSGLLLFTVGLYQEEEK